jgi:membrane protease YdiL (CAAX protease family)
MNPPPPTRNWQVFKLLWQAARRRAAGRRKRQRELMHRKTGSTTNSLGCLATVVMAVFMGIVHLALGWMLVDTLNVVPLATAEQNGKLAIPAYLNDELLSLQRDAGIEEQVWEPGTGKLGSRVRLDFSLHQFASQVARWKKSQTGGTTEHFEPLVEQQYRLHGAAGFVVLEKLSLRHPQQIPAGFWVVASLVMLWWLTMMVFQGEGLEMDVQRRRHPMWEWLLSHPVRPVAAFAAELLAPLMANPVFIAAPVFWWMVLAQVFGVFGTLIGGLVVGLAFAVAASCLNKSLEIAAMLRMPPRHRGAVLGLMSWAGYAAMLLPVFTLQAPKLKYLAAKTLAPAADWLPTWPTRSLVVGWGQQPELWQVMAAGVAAALGLLALALAVAGWGVARGLHAEDRSGGVVVRSALAGGTGWLARHPLYRKEILWFLRDKGAVVQAVLIPLTVGAMQAFNLRGLVNHALGQWHGLCGMAVLCGTYFLLVLGPRSLASEGGALWLALTWPHGLEELLKAKARLWWWLSNIIVGLALAAGVVMFPTDWLGIVLVAACWLVFSRSLAEKAVTLVVAPSSSGEAEPPSRGRQWAAMLGTFAFASGVLSGAWHVAILGVVYSALTAAAMWQNFRARLPYLFDPWSEKLPPAPSLMHAMIGIAVMVEVVGLATGITVGTAGMQWLWVARALSYGIVGLTAWFFMDRFLHRRGVTAGEIWSWPRAERTPGLGSSLCVAAVLGIGLGGLGLFYLAALSWLPLTRGWLDQAGEMAALHAGHRLWLAALAVGMAPLAEEYFFRGLLYRALDREWGGWRALVGSAAFFAIYHPPLSWLPVFGVGLTSAWLFKRSGRLAPCVVLHMVYNAVVVGLG